MVARAAASRAAELVTADNRYSGDFIEYLYGRTLFDRLPLRQVPANVTIKGQDGAATGYWVGESKGIPVTTADFSSVSLTPLKVGAIAVISNELMRDSTPSAEMLVRDALVNGIGTADRHDLPVDVGSERWRVAGRHPERCQRLERLGIDGDALRADVKTLYSDFIPAKNATGLTFLMNPSLAKSIQLLTNALGQPSSRASPPPAARCSATRS